MSFSFLSFHWEMLEWSSCYISLFCNLGDVTTSVKSTVALLDIIKNNKNQMVSVSGKLNTMLAEIYLIKHCSGLLLTINSLKILKIKLILHVTSIHFSFYVYSKQPRFNCFSYFFYYVVAVRVHWFFPNIYKKIILYLL